MFKEAKTTSSASTNSSPKKNNKIKRAKVAGKIPPTVLNAVIRAQPSSVDTYSYYLSIEISNENNSTLEGIKEFAAQFEPNGDAPSGSIQNSDWELSSLAGDTQANSYDDLFYAITFSGTPSTEDTYSVIIESSAEDTDVEEFSFGEVLVVFEA